MTREEFIEEIKARGMEGDFWGSHVYTYGNDYAIDYKNKATVGNAMKGVLFTLPYSAITSDLITAVVGPRKASK